MIDHSGTERSRCNENEKGPDRRKIDPGQMSSRAKQGGRSSLTQSKLEKLMKT
jgi:hypothetical protein